MQDAHPDVTRSILWVVPKWPLPADDGARVATTTLVRELCAQGWTIDLIAVAPSIELGSADKLREALGVRQVFLVDRPASPTKPIKRTMQMLTAAIQRPDTPVTMHAFVSSSVQRALDERIRHGGYWALVYDGLHPAAHAWRGGKYHRPTGLHRVCYRAHNVEQNIWQRTFLQLKNPFAKLFVMYQAGLVGRVERALAREADTVATVSVEDLNLFRRENASVRGAVVPIGYRFDPAPPHPAAETPPLMFLGHLDWLPNKEGLAWFMREVWPETIRLRPSSRLTVAGSGNGDWFKEYAHAPGVTFLGRIGRVDDLYLESSVAIVPVFFGSGTRVKAIEAARFGRVCVSTALGVEGTGLTPGETYLRAETATEWINVLATLATPDAREIGLRSHSALKRRFDPTAAAATFAALLEGSCDVSSPARPST